MTLAATARPLLALGLAASIACGTRPSGRPGSQAAVVAALDATAYRARVPAPRPPAPLHAPVPEVAHLDNGLTVMTVAKHDLPLVAVAAVIKSGSAQDGPGREGLASFTAEMLRLGTAAHDAAALADAVESRGTSLELDVDEDAITVGLTALTGNFPELFDVLAEVLQHSTFAPAEIERLRKQRAAALAQRHDEPPHAAARSFRRAVYGAHPYAHLPLGEEAANGHIDRAALTGYYAAHVRPANVAIVLVGDIDPAAALAATRARLGAWRGAPGVQAPPPAPRAQPPQVVLVPRLGAPQSQVVVGALGVARGDPDYFPLVLCNAILGGLFNSRINMNLREDKGYTYGARSSFDFMRGQGPFFVASGIRTDATELAIREIFKEIDGIRDADVQPDELTAAKNRYALSLPGSFQTVDGIAGMVASQFIFDLPADYYQHVPEHIDAVTVAQVRQVAQRHLTPANLSVVVVGDRGSVATGLADLQRGPVTIESHAPAPR